MNNNIRLLLLTVLFVYGCQLPTKRNEDVMRCSNISSEISNQAITCFGEDKFGYIWIGTACGLNRYNGAIYHQYFNTNTLKSERNRIQVIFKDSRQQLWIGTKNGVLRYNEQDYFENIPITGNDFDVMQMFEDRDGRIYINTSRQLLQYIPKSNQFIPRLKLKIGVSPDFAIVDPSHSCFVDSLNRIWIVGPSTINCYKSGSFHLIFSYKRDRLTHYYYSFLDKFGILWFTSGTKLEQLDTRKKRLQPLPEAIVNDPILSKAIIILIQPYKKNSLLINTNKNGLFLYDKGKKVIRQSENRFPFSLPSFDITTIFKDSRKNIWIGSADHGYKVIYGYSRFFNTDFVLSNATQQKSVIAVSYDKSGNYWIATQSNELIIYNSKSRNKTIVDLHSFFPEDPYFQDKIYSIIHDDNNTWILTSGGKVLKCVYRHNKLVRTHTYIIKSKTYEIIEDKNGTIWIGSANGIYRINKNSTLIKKVVSFPEKTPIKCKITLLATGDVFACLSNGRFYIINPNKKQITVMSFNKKVLGSQFTPNDLYTDSDGNVWIGTSDNGLYLYKVKTRQIQKIKRLLCNDIYSITQDLEGKIWIGTSQGLYKIDKKTFKSVGLYKYDGIGGNQFNGGAALTLYNNTLIFGGTHGLTMFNPQNIVTNKKVPLLFEDLFVNNRITEPGKSSCIEKSLAYKPKINLKYDQNYVNISFTAVDYREYPHIRYFYKLAGYDKDWIDSHENRSANYSNLPAGNYIFKVRITSLDNSTRLAENSISIHITRAPWLSIPALLLYFLLTFSLVWYVLHLYTTIKINRVKAIIASKEKEHEVYINKMNQNFFTNISHELRTSLTIISGPVSALYKVSEASGSRPLLDIIHRGADRMLRLINQVLSFNQLDNDALRLNVAQIDVVRELINVTDFFKAGAKQKGVNLNVYGLETPCNMLLDKDKFEDVIMNLLSNAIKFTVKGNNINIQFQVVQGKQVVPIFPIEDKKLGYNFIKVSVEDDGIGIPSDKLEIIFQRFTQLDETNHFSTGIGLYYVRRLIELHHGYIKAEKREEKGACFSFILPISAEAYSSSENSLSHVNDKVYFNNNDFVVEPPIESASSGKETILIVDDDLEISNYLKIMLEPYYRIINKYDAESAIQTIEGEVPDLILSDVLMPGMDGFQFCKIMKESDAFSHIPFVLLTAKSMINDQIEGLEFGANAYVIKPFEPAYLLALLKSQLRNRDLARNTLGNTTSADDISEETLSPRDKIFMNALYKLMETELSSADLNVNQMIEVFKMGRTKFFNKVKGLTGETPNIFFKTYKLNRAAELIIEGKYNLSEIADMTGFNTLSYFSVSFKKKFGVTPSEYKGVK